MGSKPWHHEDPEVFRLMRERLRVEYPELHLSERGDRVFVSGVFPLEDDQRMVERYEIEIRLPRTHPRGIPELRETGGRIPRDPDHHMESDGMACLFIPDEYSYRHPDGMDLFEFLKGPVLGYFVGQGLVARGEPWPFETRRHFGVGITDFYGEIIGSNDPKVVRGYLEVLAAKQVRGHWHCPCGSRKRIRKCHRELLEELRLRIPPGIASASLVKLD
jgi:hypothetical protein